MSWRALIESCSLLLPAWWVWNPGQGGGGGGTVHTDGVTIQGDGSVASPVALLDAMTDGSTLLGAGIAANKLAIIPSIYLSAMSGSNFTGFTENFVAVCGFTVPTPLTFSNLVINIANADDAPVLNDFGIYDFAGNLIANTGPFSFPVATQPVFPMQQGEQTIPQGLYLFAATSDGDGLAIYGDTNSFSWFETTAYTGFPTGGSLPSTIPPPGIVPNLQTFCVALF